jgi:hypothetical protein
MKACTSLAAALLLGLVPHARAAATAGHVLLVSIDGMHASDLSAWIAQHPDGNLARLAGHGVTYSAARTPLPSDSFPGLCALVTGGTPNSTGIWYDATYDRRLLPPAGAPKLGSAGASVPGTLVNFDESIDLGYNHGKFGSGADPMQFCGASAIDPALLPLDPQSGAPVYPHAYLRVNTIFEVAHGAGLRTAWVDKHPAYDLVTGPSGAGVDDLYTPEINSPVPGGPSKFDKRLPDAIGYDGLKVQAVVNQIRGLDHAGKAKVGVPALLGMNFQVVSVAQKLPDGGYQGAKGADFSPLLAQGLQAADDGIGRLTAALEAEQIAKDTLVVVTAKHGQSPIDPAGLTRFDDTPKSKLDPANPNPTSVTEYLFAKGIRAFTNGNDTCYFLWLQNPAQAAAAAAALRAAPAASLGPIASILAGDALGSLFNAPAADARVPDLILLPPPGTVYTDGKKIAEHGGFNPEDREVCLLLAMTGWRKTTVTQPVATTQVAPTILKALGLEPGKLQAVVKEGTTVLPGLPF